jgi:hypothetical protein
MKILDYAVDYREIDPRMECIMGTEIVMNLVRKNGFSKKAQGILGSLYEFLTPLKKHAFLLLNQIPSQRKTLDLTLFEGSGFYHYDEPYWIYHKGGGCIEALAIKKRFGLNPLYPSFGAEYHGDLGTFSSSSLLGVKRLWQCIHEFLSSLTLLGHAIEHNDSIKCYKDVIGQMVIPLCVVSLPKLSEIIQNNLHNKPDLIVKSYKDTCNENQAAKILMLVPSPIRATDNYDIEGKWFETSNVFHRITSLHKTKLHNFGRSPFWDEEQTKIRGRTIATMFNAGFVFQPISSHLQNYYLVPTPREGKIALNAADFCDFLPLESLNQNTLECVLQNILNGWRIAESSGPVYTVHNSAISFKEILNLARLFFEEFLGDQYCREIEKFYVLLPFSSCVSIIKIFSSFQLKNQSISVWKEMLSCIMYAEAVQKKIALIVERYKNECKTLLKPLSKIRSSALINEIINHLSGRESEISRDITALFDQIMTFQTTDKNKKNIIYYVGYAVELSFFLGKDSHQVIHCIASHLISLLKIEEITIALLEEYTETLKGKSLRRFMKYHLEEAIHVKHHDLRSWILNTDDPQIVKNWIQHFLTCTEELMKFPLLLLQDYLGFTFKRDHVLEAIQASHINSSIKFHLSRLWNGEEKPVYRTYPVVEFKNDMSDQELKRLFIVFTRLVHKIGFNL